MENLVLKTIKERRSVKAYSDEVVSDELIDQITEAGTYAACGRGAQAGEIVVIKDRALRDKLAKLNAEILHAEVDPFYNAPVVIVVLADSSIPTYVEDGSLILGNMMLAATSLGVDSCWIHRARQMFETDFGKELLKKWGLPETYKGVGNLIIGYRSKGLGERKARKANFVIKD